MTKTWLYRIALRGAVFGTALVVASFLFGLVIAYRWRGIAGLANMFEMRPAELAFFRKAVAIEFAFGFVLSPLYELCRWLDMTAKAWWASRQNSN